MAAKTKQERLAMILRRMGARSPFSSVDEARSAFDEEIKFIEDEYSGVEENPEDSIMNPNIIPNTSANT